MKVTTKVIWAVVIALCVCALGFIWFVGFPVPEYKATDDGAQPMHYVVQVAPYTYFNVNMSANEVLTRTDGYSFYEFEKASILTNKAKTDADLIDAEKQVYGRSGSFIYRIFDASVITVRSNRSMAQPLEAFTSLDTYEIPGYFDDLKIAEEPFNFGNELCMYKEVLDGVYASKDYEYSNANDNDNLAFAYYGPGGSYYTAQIFYGTAYDAIQQSLSRLKACSGVTYDNYYTGDNYWLFSKDSTMLAIKKINRNTNIVLITNMTKQMPALLYSLKGGD